MMYEFIMPLLSNQNTTTVKLQTKLQQKATLLGPQPTRSLFKIFIVMFFENKLLYMSQKKRTENPYHFVRYYVMGLQIVFQASKPKLRVIDLGSLQIILNQVQQLMQSNDDKKIEVTEEQAFAWIQKYNKDINPNQWRYRYIEKLGLGQKQAQEETELQKEDQFENDKYYINFFSQRTSQNIRNRYLSKLMIGQAKEDERPRKKNQHIFIFDWDDTILCTTYLSSFQFLDIGPETKSLLEKLDECSFKLLEKSVERGQKIFIITNAAKGWVEYSSKIYLPKSHGIIAGSSIKIISARSMFGEEFPGDFARWKIEAFKSILNTTDRNLVTNLICIGDSNIEMEAAHSLSKQFEHSLVKTIKFRENPKPQELIKQQELVFERMKQIFESTKNLTIRLQRKNSKQKK